MKRLLAGLTFLLWVFVSSSAFAGMPIKQAGNFGVGLGVGTTAFPISVKYFLDPTLSLQGNIGAFRGPYYGCGRWRRDRYRGYSCGYVGDALGIGGDVLYEGGPLAGNEDVNLSWEVGGGAGIGVGDPGFAMALAFVAGLQLNIEAIPIDLVLEYRLPLYFVPFFDIIEIDFTGHVRYYF